MSMKWTPEEDAIIRESGWDVGQGAAKRVLASNGYCRSASGIRNRMVHLGMAPPKELTFGEHDEKIRHMIIAKWDQGVAIPGIVSLIFQEYGICARRQTVHGVVRRRNIQERAKPSTNDAENDTPDGAERRMPEKKFRPRAPAKSTSKEVAARRKERNEKIVEMHVNGASRNEIAVFFGVSVDTVHDVVTKEARDRAAETASNPYRHIFERGPSMGGSIRTKVMSAGFCGRSPDVEAADPAVAAYDGTPFRGGRYPKGQTMHDRSYLSSSSSMCVDVA